MIRLRTLGACVIEVGTTAIGPEAERLFGVLLYLTTERGRRTSRRALQELLWPEADELRARHNLRQAIYRLRQAGVEIDGTMTGLHLPADQVAFDPFDLLSGDAAAAGDALLGGLVGEYLAGYSPTFSEPYAVWVEGQRAFAHARVARAAVGAMLERRARGRWSEVEQLAQICLRYDPLNEEATLALAESAAMVGSKARALAILDAYIAELGEGTSIQLPATLLRRRIAERLPDPSYTVPSESCFVGRDDSLRFLHDLFGHARAGRGQCCLVAGEPGIGKSRLVSEFARVGTLQGAQVQRMGCQARDAERPLALFVDSVPALLKLPGAIGCSPRSMSYLKRLTEHDPTATAPSEDSREAAYLYANVRRSVLDLLDAIAQERALLLIVEDVHWADPASWDILRDMIGWCAGRKVLLLLTSRVAQAGTAAVETLPVVIHHLAPLSEGASTQLRDALTDERQRRPSDEFRAWLVRAADGNPLFLRELVIHWLETGEERAVPPSLRALLAERLGRLGPRARRVFQACAVMGAKATFEWLQPVLGYRPHELLDGLQELEGAGLLTARAGGVRSRHELVADEALRELPEAARAYLHRQVALVLEPEVRTAAPADASVLWECAEHWRRAGEPGRAWSVVMSCGAYLLEVGLPESAAEVFEKAELYTSVESEIRRCRIGLARALVHGGKWAHARPLLQDLLAKGAQREVGEGEHDLELHLLRADIQLGCDIEVIRDKSMQRGFDRSLPLGARLEFATLAMALADQTCSLDSLQAAFAGVSESLSHPVIRTVERATVLMIYHTACGDPDVALDAARVVVGERQKGDSPGALAKALRCAAHVSKRCGLLEESRNYLLRSVHTAEQHNLVTQAIQGFGMLSEYYFNALDFAEAKVWHTRAVEWACRAEDPVLAASNAVFAAKLALVEGRVTDAERALSPQDLRALDTTTTTTRVEALAAQLHLAVALNARRVSQNLRDQFDSLFERMVPFGELDYAAIVRYLHDATLNPTTAYTRLVTYVRTERRERGALPAMLEQAVSGVAPLFRAN